MRISVGIPPGDRAIAADLYWQAFGGKLGRTLGPEPRALAYINRVMRADHGICAHDAAGRLLGVAGFKTAQGGLVGGTYRDMQQIYGTMGAAWRAACLSLLEREIENERFVMDGLFVDPACRGMGVGTALLHGVMAEARRRGYAQVRLDVVDGNTRARTLYLQMGFTDLKTSRIGPLRHIFGFDRATTMIKTVGPGADGRL